MYASIEMMGLIFFFFLSLFCKMIFFRIVRGEEEGEGTKRRLKNQSS